MLALEFITGSAVIMATGIPGTGSIVDVIIAVFIAVIGLKIVDKVGAATVLVTVSGILSIPTLINGPPGIHKILVMLIVGLTIDVILLLSERSNRGYIFAGLFVGVEIIILIYISLVLLGLPGEQQLRAILIPISLISGIMGAAGAYLGIKVYEGRLKHLSVVQSLKS